MLAEVELFVSCRAIGTPRVLRFAGVLATVTNKSAVTSGVFSPMLPSYIEITGNYSNQPQAPVATPCGSAATPRSAFSTADFARDVLTTRSVHHDTQPVILGHNF